MYKTINKRFFDKLSQPQKKKLIYGGAGSGKSIAVAQFLCQKLCSGDGSRNVVLRKYFPSMKVSTYLVIKSILESWGVSHRVKEHKTDHYLQVGDNYLYYMSVDDVSRFKGSEFNVIWLEESTEFSEDDYKQLSIRLSRDVNSEDVTMILTFNPVSQNHWCVKLLEQAMREPDNFLVMHSTYKDNVKNLSKTFIHELESYAATDMNFYRVYCKGEPGVLENIIYSNFQIEDSRKWPWNRLNEGIHAYGLDFGFNVPMALVEVFYSEGEFYIRELFYKRECTTDDLAQWMQVNRVDHNAYIYADAAEPDRIASLCQSKLITSTITGREFTTMVNRFNVHAANKAVSSGIDFVKSQKIHLCAQAVNIIKEVQNYRFKQTREGIVIDEPIKVGDHGMDAVRYCLYSMGVNQLNIIPSGLSKGYSFSSSLSVNKFRL
jgi:phage terminase large subunit